MGTFLEAVLALTSGSSPDKVPSKQDSLGSLEEGQLFLAGNRLALEHCKPSEIISLLLAS